MFTGVQFTLDVSQGFVEELEWVSNQQWNITSHFFFFARRSHGCSSPRFLRVSVAVESRLSNTIMLKYGVSWRCTADRGAFVCAGGTKNDKV